MTVSGLSSVIAIAAGGFHSCAIVSGNTARCWGDNVSGQLGNGSTSDSLTPVTVSGLSTAAAITAGDYHSCALTTDEHCPMLG